MPTVSRYLDPLDVEEPSLCEKPAKVLNQTDKSIKPFVESELKIEIDPPEQQVEPKYFLEKWPPERSFVSDKFTKQLLPEFSPLPRYIIETNETTIPKPVMRMNNLVKKPVGQTPIQAFNL